MNTDIDLEPFVAAEETSRRLSYWHVREEALEAGYCTHLMDLVLNENSATLFTAYDPDDGDLVFNYDLREWVLPVVRGVIFGQYECASKRCEYQFGEVAAEIYDRIMFITQHFNGETQRFWFAYDTHWAGANNRTIWNGWMSERGWDQSRMLAKHKFYDMLEKLH